MTRGACRRRHSALRNYGRTHRWRSTLRNYGLARSYLLSLTSDSPARLRTER